MKLEGKFKIPCPKCGVKTEVPSKDIKPGTKFTCSGCKTVVTLTGDDLGKKADDAIKMMKKSFRD